MEIIPFNIKQFSESYNSETSINVSEYIQGVLSISLKIDLRRGKHLTLFRLISQVTTSGLRPNDPRNEKTSSDVQTKLKQI